MKYFQKFSPECPFKIHSKKVANIAKYLTGNILETITAQRHNNKNTRAFF